MQAELEVKVFLPAQMSSDSMSSEEQRQDIPAVQD